MKHTLILFPLVLFSCLPKRLVPLDYSVEQNNLEAFIELDSITLGLVNLQAKGDHLVFNMTVENNRSEPIFLNVTKLQRFASNIPYRDSVAMAHPLEVTSAMSPEQINQFFKAKKENAEAAAFFLFLVGAAFVTYDALKDGEDERKSYWTEDDEKKSATRDLVVATALFATDALTEIAEHSHQAAQTELHYLPAEVFDREVIYPGESYSGKVLFRQIGVLQKHHRIVFPLEEQKLNFDFRKATYKEREFLYSKGM